MTLEQLLSVLGVLRDVDVWLTGGWGVDALVGRQTRAHHDADLLVRDEDAEHVIARLRDCGYRVTLDERPDRVVLHDAAGARVDLNLVVFVDSGDAYQRGDDGWFELFPASGFTRGVVGGQAVGCLSAAVQREKHRGFDLRPHHEADVGVLDELLAG